MAVMHLEKDQREPLEEKHWAMRFQMVQDGGETSRDEFANRRLKRIGHQTITGLATRDLVFPVHLLSLVDVKADLLRVQPVSS